MDLRQLRYFIAILEQGSFSKASQYLHVAQPALSHHVRQMEDDLGVELMVRGPRGVTPTQAGERLLHHARLIMRQVDAARDEVRSMAGDPGGAVVVGLPGTVSQILSVPLIEAVRARYPRIQPRIAEAMSGFIHEWLRDGTVDFGIIYRTGDARGLTTHHVLSEELCLLGPPGCDLAEAADGSVAFAVAAKLGLILPGSAHNLRQQLEEAASRRNLSLDVDIEIDAYQQIKALAAKGMGFSILPRMAVEADAAAGRLSVWRIVNPVLTRDVFLARAKDRPLTAAGKAALDVCWRTLRELVESGAWIAEFNDAEPDDN